MRRFSFATATAALLLLAGCSMSEQNQEMKAGARIKAVKVHFTTRATDTKTAFEGFDEASSTYPVSWTGNDQFIAMSMNFAGPVEAEVIRDRNASGKADFTATFEDSGSPYRFLAISPLSAVRTMSGSRESWNVTIPTVQTPKADGLSCDEAAMILWAKTGTFTTIPEMPIELQFEHMTAYCRLVLKNLSAALASNNASGASVKSVDVTYSIPVAGDFFIDAENGGIQAKEASHTITIMPAVEDLSQPTDIWFALAPCTLDGATVKVSVNTDKGSLAREYTFGQRTYAAGSVNKLTLDMTRNTSFDPHVVTKEETVFELVKSINNLAQNDEVIFADAKVPLFAMTGTASTSGIASVAKDAANGFIYDPEDGYIRLPEGSDVAVLKIAGKTSSAISFSCGTSYLGYTGSNKTYMLSFSTSPTQFTTSIAQDGSARLSYVKGRTAVYVFHNETDFNLGSSSETTIAIFKKKNITTTSSIDPDNDPILLEEQYGAYLTSGNTVHIPRTSQLSRETAASNVTFAILFPAGNRILEFDGIPAGAVKGDSFTLRLTHIEGRKRTSLGSFEVSVIKEEGASLWLSDFKGNGFIVKR